MSENLGMPRQPELRFAQPDGSAYPDWEEATFGEVFSLLTTTSNSRAELTYESGTIRNIHYGDIHTKLPMFICGDDTIIPFIKEEYAPSDEREELFLQDGDLIIADASEDEKDLCKSVVVVDIRGQKILAGLHTFLARDDSGHTYPIFNGYLMQSFIVREYLGRVSTGISVLSVSKTNLKKMPVLLPPVAEQRKIADLLSLIDNKIASLKAQAG